MKLTITPNDAVSFGRGKTTSAGETAFGVDMFPPCPTVFYGALRGAFLSQNPKFIETADIQAQDPTLNYELAFCSLLLHGKPYFPAPADLFSAGGEQTLRKMKLRENDGLSSHNLDFYLWAENDGKVSNSEGKYVSAEIMRKYLRGEVEDVEFVDLEEFTEREVRIGIARDNSLKAAAESMLYNTSMTRLKEGASFAVDIIGEQLPNSNGVLRLGKHGKTARYATTDFDANIGGKIGDNGLFKLYFATPAIFANGSEPVLPVPKVKLIAAAVNGYENIGGYDMLKNAPKTMRRAVKAGSVFYYKLEDNTPQNRAAIAEKLNNKRISQELANAGLGLCFTGIV